MTDAEFPRNGDSGSGTEYGYLVEVRWMCNGESTVVDGIPLGPKWKVIQPEPELSIPRGMELSRMRREWLYGYASAQAIRWWFIARAKAERHGMDACLETRLVRYRREYSYRAVAEDEEQALTFRDTYGERPSSPKKEVAP